MDISHYFSPVAIHPKPLICEDAMVIMANKMVVYTEDSEFPEVPKGALVLFGVPDDRSSVGNRGCAAAPDAIREYLYALAVPQSDVAMYDLGNLIPGKEVEDTYYALIDVLQDLLDRQVTVVLLGGGQDLTYAVYKTYEVLGRIVNICSVDSRFDIFDAPKVTSRSYLNHIIMQQPNYLFNYTVMGYQSYLVGNDHIKLMNDLNFDAYRLGVLQEDMQRAEPLVRNADMVSVDIGAVRQSDAPANAYPSPHGFYGEQLCQIARFAGFSDKVSVFGLFELNPPFDQMGQTAHMVAHAIWYFIEGYQHRQADFPYIDQTNYKRFVVYMDAQDMEIVFYKSRKTDRWWVEVPCENEEFRQRYMRHLIIPCTYADYKRAMQNEIPELWWRYYQRILQW
ncbi:MAG: formimidoylglutamase [Bacteroidales bacterium]|nr:formimidoylglutamase [Candidatus Colimorpha onthohippi]